MRNLALTLMLLFSAGRLGAQFHETIKTGRPGQSIGSFGAGRGIFQVQSGVDYFESSGGNTTTSGWVSNTVLRYGLTEPFEVNAMVEYKTERERPGSGTLNGFTAVDIGMRYHVCSAKKLLPNVGLQMRWRIPQLSGDFPIEQWAPRFVIVISRKLSEKLYLITNWGASWSGNNEGPHASYTINLSYPLTPRFGVFVENYGTATASGWKIYADGGFAFLLNNDLQLDMYAGVGRNRGVSDFLVSAGVSWRTKRKEP